MGEVHAFCHRFFLRSDVGDMTLEEVYDNIMHSLEVKAFIAESSHKQQAKWNVHAIISAHFRMWIDGKMK